MLYCLYCTLSLALPVKKKNCYLLCKKTDPLKEHRQTVDNVDVVDVVDVVNDVDDVQ